MSGFVVMVRGVDDSYTAYGPVRREDRAESFVAWFNTQVEIHERTHPDEPEGVAWAYVMPLHTLGSSEMLADSGLAVKVPA